MTNRRASLRRFNRDGFFQVIAGCELRSNDDELAEQVIEITRKTARLCPFTIPDRAKIDAFFSRTWA
jgi:hypothetical protein